NYPVWIVTSALMGLLIATYVAPPGERAAREESTVEVGERRDARTGTAAGMLAWFAVGCPVCNKIALLALGYSGALTWFAPAQPSGWPPPQPRRGLPPLRAGASGAVGAAGDGAAVVP